MVGFLMQELHHTLRPPLQVPDLEARSCLERFGGAVLLVSFGGRGLA